MDRDILFALSLVNGVGIRTIRKIIESENQIQTILSTIQYNNFELILNDLSKYKNILSENNIKFSTYLDFDYPLDYKLDSEVPLILYYKSNKYSDLEFLRNKVIIGMVGARNIVTQSIDNINSVINILDREKNITISGLAFGVDAEVHERSINNSIDTIAVMPCPLNTCVPIQNYSLFLKIIDHGVLISEYFPFTKISKGSFVNRNRIIALLSNKIIIVQASTSSGSLVTANYARRYNKELLAITGNFNDENFTGCNDLVYNADAKIFTISAINNIEQIDVDTLDNTDDLLYLIKSKNGISYEDISAKNFTNTDERLFNLELEGKISVKNSLYY